MTTAEAIKHFGTQAELARQLDISDGAIAQWGEFPPKGRQFEIQALTNGVLKAEPKAPANAA